MITELRMNNGVRCVIRHIPFYDAEEVKAKLTGRLRGRGQRTGFENPRALPSKYCPDGYKYSSYALAQSLPKHLATEFTLYTPGTWYSRQYFCDFKGIEPNGKIRIALKPNVKPGVRS